LAEFPFWQSYYTSRIKCRRLCNTQYVRESIVSKFDCQIWSQVSRFSLVIWNKESRIMTKPHSWIDVHFCYNYLLYYYVQRTMGRCVSNYMEICRTFPTDTNPFATHASRYIWRAGGSVARSSVLYVAVRLIKELYWFHREMRMTPSDSTYVGLLFLV
jgi:hypothetical protein